MRKLTLILIAALVAAQSSLALAASNREVHRFGLHLGLLGDPFPTLAGFNVDYNLAAFMRVTGGYGSISSTTGLSSLSLTTIGGGARFFLPDANFSPVLGLSYANVTATYTGAFIGTVGGFSASGSHAYVTAGLDWQALSGFNFGVGYNLSLLSGVGGLPYINFGWFF